MSEEKKKTRKHVILDIPVLGPILWALVLFVVSEGIFGGILGFGYGVVTGTRNITAVTFALALGGVIALLLYKPWFRGEFKGAFSGNFGDRKTKIWYFVCVGLTAIAIILGYMEVGVQPPTLAMLATALMAGFCEEVSFRLAPISVIMRKPATKSSITLALVLSTILFGLVHATNLAEGQSVAGTVFQVIGVMGLGVFFGAVYLRTGNLLLTIAFHSVYDFLVLMSAAANGSIVDNGASSMMDIAQDAGFEILCAICGILIIVGKTKEIEEVWKDRWNR